MAGGMEWVWYCTVLSVISNTLPITGRQRIEFAKALASCTPASLQTQVNNTPAACLLIITTTVQRVLAISAHGLGVGFSLVPSTYGVPISHPESSLLIPQFDPSPSCIFTTITPRQHRT